MRVHNSWLMAVVPVPIIVVSFLLVVPFTAPEFDFSAKSVGLVVLVSGGFGLLTGLPLRLFPRAEIYGDRLRGKGRGWGPWQVLGPGERFVICRNAVHIQRSDGSVKRTGLAKWSTAAKDWRRIEQWFPTIDPVRTREH